MRKYPVELVKDLEDSNAHITRQRANVILKKTRDTRDGSIDPWEKRYHIMTDPKPVGNTDDDFIDAFREACGSHNYNLNEKEICTEFFPLYLVDYGTVGVWYYYLRRRKKTPRPCLVYIHGGGWVAGSVYTMENPCKLIAELADAVVFNIDYTLAPEGHFPVSYKQLWYVISYIYKNADLYGIDKERIMVAGDSAGGNLAAALTLGDARKHMNRIAAQFLIYPCVVLGNKRAEGYHWNRDEYSFNQEDSDIIRKVLKLGTGLPESDCTEILEKLYVPNSLLLTSSEVSPMLASNLSKQAKTFIVTAEYDILRQQAEFYGGQLERAGVSVKTMCYCGCYHAFFEKLGYVPQSEAVCIEIAKELVNL